METKEKKPIKRYIFGGIAVAFVALLIVANVSEKRKEKQAQIEAEAQALAEAEAEASNENNVDENGEEYSEEEEMQKVLEGIFGEAPEGFRWSDNGELLAVSDDSVMPEDVLFSFLRSLSMLDFANAKKYSSQSSIITLYNNYYSNDSLSGDYIAFARKLLSECLTKTELLNIEREAVFAQGQKVYTVNIQLPDLSMRTFWEGQEDELFSQYRDRISTGNGGTAMEFIYANLLDYFSSDNYPIRNITVDIVLNKVTNGGWLVTDDSDLATYLVYDDVGITAEKFKQEYESWLSKHSGGYN